MDVREFVDDHWLALYLLADLGIFLVAVLLWKPGTRGLAAGVFMVSLILFLAFLGSLFSGLIVEDESDDKRQRD